MAESNINLPSHLQSLFNTLSLVPAVAVSPIIDCVIASSTDISSSLLFSSLLSSFRDITMDAGVDRLISHATALCHLTRMSEDPAGDLRVLIWKVFVPIMKITNANDLGLITQLEGLLFDVASKMQLMKITSEILVPYCLRSICLGINMIQSQNLAIYEWTSKDFISCPGVFPQPIACHVLISLLGCLTSHIKIKTMQKLEGLAANILWDLSNLAYGMLLMSTEGRSISVHLLLPTVFKFFNTFFSINVSLDGEPHVLTRSSFGKKIWQFCISLFSLGHVERLDAYGVLYLYVSSFSRGDLNIGLSADHHEEFDVRYEKVFWDEIQRGLVDKDVHLRKHALHILKILLWDHFSNEASSSSPNNKHNISCNGSSSQVNHISKRGKWAEKEAKSLGVGEVCHLSDGCLSTQDKWKVFLLLYEMLEEYGTHLVDAAWTHQISLLFEPCSSVNYKDSARKDVYQAQMETMEGIFSWLAILWERGFFHDNPLVRCLIMQSFLSIDWQNSKQSAQIIPKRFVLGPLILGLNDPVHHKDFGLDGKYTSKTLQEATHFFSNLCWEFSARERADFVCSLTSVAKNESFCRAGLMALSFCIASVACTTNDFPRQEHMEYNRDISSKQSDLLDVLGVVIERSKQHFNPKYRLQVCEQIIKAAASVVNRDNVSTEVLLYFLSAVPREFTDRAGFLRDTVKSWLTEGNNKSTDPGPFDDKDLILKYLVSFPASFTNQTHLCDTSSFDDDDVEAWEFEARRWARVLFLVADVALCLDPILMFFKEHCLNLCREDLNACIYSVKLLILIKCVVDELHREWGKIVSRNETYIGTASGRIKILDQSSFTSTFSDFGKFVRPFIHIMEEVVSFSKFVTPVLWSGSSIAASRLADSIKGKLGGKSLRRLAPSIVPSVWQAIMSVGTVAQLLMWFAHMKEYDHLHSSLIFTWEFSWKVIQNNTFNSETDAELCLAAYESLSYVFKAWTMTLTSSFFSYIVSCNKLLFPDAEDLPILDPLLVSFLENINHLLANGVLKRSRRAVLMNWKWHCLDSLLSIPYYGTQNGVHVSKAVPFFSNFFLRSTFTDIVESLENAGENSVLYILRSLRSVIGLLCPISTTSVIPYGGVNVKMMQQLVHSSWILHLSCNKRRVASIAAILSTVLHHSVFSDLSMHGTHDSQQGPLKWFIEKLLENGVKSPRTIRLAALHLTGLWLLHPETLKYYIKELKLLSLYGSVAFDEDFEAELNDNHDAKTEVSFLAQSPDRELTEVFINTELYARVSVAVLFYKLAEIANHREKHHNGNSLAAHNCGKAFLLELLDSAVNDKELSKELYKKYSATHRRKVRAWQMICVLSHFVDNDIVQEVTTKLHTCLCRNNLPGVRQYLETFAIQVYLDFPSLAEEQLIPIFYDYTMKPQALSSYVFIATNVILHARDRLIQINHMNSLLPPIIPFLTSHHHSLRGFTQLLVHHVLCKMWPALKTNSSNGAPLEKKCFEDLKSYLAENVDCARLRKSMECFLDAFDPITSTSPSGVFSARNEGSEFECAPISLMEHVITFLNDVRDNLRNSIANDAITMENESITEEMPNQNSEKSLQTAYDISLDFQKKITLYENSRQAVDTRSECFLSEMEKEDQLLNPIIQSRNQAMAKIRESQQQFILVASLLDRIPNLAGLARTCEIFKAAGLAVANATVMQDKQFQLISVTAEKWVPIIEVPVNSMKIFLEKKRKEGFSILGLEQTANSTSLEKFSFPDKTVLVLGREREGIPVDIIHVLDACIEIPQLGIIRSLNVHVSGAIALWEYTRQQRLKKQ